MKKYTILKYWYYQYKEAYSLRDKIIQWLFKLGGILVLLILLLIFGYLFKNSFYFIFNTNPAEFLFSSRWFPASLVKVEYGILGMLVSTILVTIGATLFSAIIGIIGAVCLSEYFPPTLKNFVRYIVEIFSAIPSVVIGLIGVTIIAPYLKELFGWTHMFNAYMACLLVGIMALPTIMSVALDSLERVPNNIKMASLGLGASKWETIYKVVLPSVKTGIYTAVMLGMGRAVGETMIVLMIGGNSLEVPTSFSDPVRTITANIAIEMGEVSQGSMHYSALFTLGLFLFLFTFIINYIVDRVASKKERL